MAMFDDIVLEWEGREYRLPANRMLGAIASIEEVITLPELVQSSERGGPPLNKIAKAFGAVLRYAGARVSDDEVYLGMFSNPQAAFSANHAVMALLQILLPPSARKRLDLGTEVEPSPGNSPATTAAS